MIRPETEKDVLAEISRNLERIANALEAIVNASVVGRTTQSDGFVSITTSNGAI